MVLWYSNYLPICLGWILCLPGKGLSFFLFEFLFWIFSYLNFLIWILLWIPGSYVRFWPFWWCSINSFLGGVGKETTEWEPVWVRAREAEWLTGRTLKYKWSPWARTKDIDGEANSVVYCLDPSATDIPNAALFSPKMPLKSGCYLIWKH